MNNVFELNTKKVFSATDGAQIPVFFSQFFDIYDPSWYLMEPTEVDNSSRKITFHQTRFDANGTVLGHSYAISSTDANGNITGYTHTTTNTDASGTYSWSNHYDSNWNVTESSYTDNTGNDVLKGGAGSDTHNGGTVNDTLTSDAGYDQFIFNISINGSTNLDTVTDFTRGGDKLVLDDAIFAQLTAGVTAGNIVVGTTTALASRTYDANDNRMFDTTTKTLYCDATAMGGDDAIAFVQLTGVSTLAHTDFFIV